MEIVGLFFLELLTLFLLSRALQKKISLFLLYALRQYKSNRVFTGNTFSPGQ